MAAVTLQVSDSGSLKVVSQLEWWLSKSFKWDAHEQSHVIVPNTAAEGTFIGDLRIK